MMVIFMTGCALRVSAQAKGAPHSSLDSLSAEDKALFALYRDSFARDLEDFLFVFDESKKKPVDTSVYNMDRSSHAEVGLDFNGPIYFNGRDVGIKGVFFAPGIAYLHKTGLYFGMSMGFYTDTGITNHTHVPLVVLAAGYQHTFFRRWCLAGGYSRSITTYGLPLFTRSLLVNNFSVSTSVDLWKHLIIGAGVYFNWSTIRISRVAALSFESHAVEVALSLRKEFIIYKFIGAKEFTITPGINAYFGNDNQAIVVQQRARGDTLQHLVKYSRQIKTFFGLLNVETSVNIDWRIRNLDIFAMPVLAVPFNTFTFNAASSTRTLNPKQYRFYAQAGIRYLFCVKKKSKPV